MTLRQFHRRLRRYWLKFRRSSRASPVFPFVIDYKIDVEKVKGNWIEQEQSAIFRHR